MTADPETTVRQSYLKLSRDAEMALKEELSAMAKEGLTMATAAEKLGLSFHQVNNRANKHGIRFHGKRGPRPKDPDARDLEMRRLFVEDGHTLEAIGEKYGITRERVRQILLKRFEIAGKDGGASAGARERKEARERARERVKEAWCFERRGCSLEEYRELTEIGRRMRNAGAGWEQTPLGTVTRQRTNAHNNGYEWRLSLWEWWTVWRESGKWDQRGRGRGYWMARKDHAKGFVPGNVVIEPGDRAASRTRKEERATIRRDSDGLLANKARHSNGLPSI